MTSEPEVLVEVSDGVGRLTLNRPRAINALTEAMCATMLDGLRAWSAPASGVRAVELHGAGERGLCAGADIKAIRALHAAAAQAFFRTEYTLNYAIATHRLPSADPLAPVPAYVVKVPSSTGGAACAADALAFSARSTRRKRGPRPQPA